MAWPPTLEDLKLDLQVTDTTKDAEYAQVLTAAVVFVERVRSGVKLGDVNFAGLVNVNTAVLAELEALGLDTATAQAVIDGRPYRNIVTVAAVVGSTVFATIEQQITVAAEPDDDLELGTIRLAGRWHTRRASRDMVIQMGELGSGRVPSFDPDIERLLRIGRQQKARVG